MCHRVPFNPRPNTSRPPYQFVATTGSPTSGPPKGSQLSHGGSGCPDCRIRHRLDQDADSAVPRTRAKTCRRAVLSITTAGRPTWAPVSTGGSEGRAAHPDQTATAGASFISDVLPLLQGRTLQPPSTPYLG